MRHFFLFFLLTIVSTIGTASPQECSIEEVVYSKKYNLKGYLSRPKGNGPFPAVVYFHGGLGPNIGGAPKETSIALAKEGYIGFSPIRRRTMPMADAIDDANEALSFINQFPDADKKKIAILGFSRGGFLALHTGANFSKIAGIIVMACAPGRRGQNEFFARLRRIKVPVLLLVAENDNKHFDHVAFARKIEATLNASQRFTRLIVYPHYKNDGHQMFSEIGYYWNDIVKFLNEMMNIANSAVIAPR